MTNAELAFKVTPEDEMEETRPRVRTRFPVRTLAVGAGVLQSGCILFIFLNSFRVWMGLTAVTAASASFVHSAPVRYGLAAISLLGAALTLGSVINAHYLRNLPSARWRRRPLAAKEILANLISVSASGLAILMVWSEVVMHHRFHP